MQALQKLQIEKGNIDKQLEDLKSASTIESRLKHLNHVYQNDKDQPFAIQYSTIQKATYDGNISGVLHFLAIKGFQKVPVDSFDTFGKACIHIASEKGHAHVVATLLSRRSNINLLTTIDSVTPLMLACGAGKVSCVEMLLKKGASIFLKNRSGFTAMHYACQGDHVEAMDILDMYCKDLKARQDPDGKPSAPKAIAIASVKSSTSSQSAPPSLEEEAPPAPLSRQNSKLPMIKSKSTLNATELLVPSSNKEVKDRGTRNQIEELLNPANKLLVSTCNMGLSPLHVACQFQSYNAAKYLADQGCDINQVDFAMHDTPLHKAGRSTSFLIYRMLVAAGANETMKNKQGETAKQLLHDDTKI
jgi:ankyrin repeat protein